MSQRKLKLQLTIRGKDHVISIGKDVVRALGNPQYVCLLKNESKHSIAIQVCDEKHVLSFRVPENLFKDKDCIFRIYSLPFAKAILEEYQLDGNTRHSFSGTYAEEHHAVEFILENVAM